MKPAIKTAPRRRRFPALCAIVLWSLAAAASGADAESPQRDYRFELPEGWRELPAQTMDAESDIELIGPNQDFVIVYRYASRDWTLDGLRRTRRELLQEDNELLSERHWRTLDNDLSVIAHGRYEVPDEELGKLIYNTHSRRVGTDLIHVIIVTDPNSPEGAAQAVLDGFSLMDQSRQRKKKGKY